MSKFSWHATGKNQQIAIAADNHVGICSQGKFQIDIILCISAIGHADSWVKLGATGGEQVEDFIAQGCVDKAGESWAMQNLEDFLADRT